MDFSWDNRKKAANELKHGVAFEEAKTVFSNPSLSFSKMKRIRQTKLEKLSSVTPGVTVYWSSVLLKGRRLFVSSAHA